jgi:hypothetical protein
VVDTPDDPAAVRAGLKPATARVPETAGHAREKHEGHDRFDLSHAPPTELPRCCVRPLSYPDADGGRGGKSKLPAQFLPSVEEFPEKLEKLNADSAALWHSEMGTTGRISVRPQGRGRLPHGGVGAVDML